MSLTLNALLDRFAECVYDIVCHTSEYLEEDKKMIIAFRSEFNHTITKVPIEFRKSKNDHYNTILLDCPLARQQLEVVCDPKTYCYKDIREWIRSVIAGMTIAGIVETDEIKEKIKNADGHLCICTVGGIAHLSIRNHKDYLGNEWLKKNYFYSGFNVNPDAPDYCFICGNWRMQSDCGQANLPIIPGALPDNFGENNPKWERFKVLCEDPYEEYNVIDNPND